MKSAKSLYFRNCLKYASFIILFLSFTGWSGKLNAVPLVGSYSINSAIVTGGTNFQSFTDFATAINTNGISGNVSVIVTPGSGPYHEQVVIGPYSGGSASAIVLLEGSSETLTAVTTTTNRHVIRLTDAHYFTVNNLRVAWDPASTGGFYGIHVFNTCDHVTVSNCILDLTGTTSTLYGGIVASGSDVSILAPGDFHNLMIYSNTSSGGGYGASVYGLSGTVHATGIVISYNTFFDFHSNGIYLRETDGTIVADNYFDKRTSNITSVNAIQVAQALNINALIYNNFIKVSQTNNGTMTFRGIYLFDGAGHKVYNNVIYDVGLTSGNFTAIDIRTGGTAPQIYFNTISIDNPATSTGDLIGIGESLSNTNSVLRNNMISISQPTTGTKAGLEIGAIATATTAFNSDYNLIYVPGGNTAMKGALTPTFYPTLANWQSASTQDAHSLNMNPQFTSLTIPVPTNPAVDNAGITLPLISGDVYGNVRGTPPDIGAIEFTATGLPENMNHVQLSCYPNPVKDQLTIQFPVLSSNEIEMTIYSIEGKFISTDMLQVIPINHTAQIDVRQLKTGIYFFKIKTNEKEYSGRFIKK